MKASFWVTNISKMNVSLADLNLTIKSYTMVNLLDMKHYDYSLEQLTKSATSGSLHKKRDKIVVRKLAPEVINDKILLDRETCIPTRERSILIIKEEHYEELAVSDEEFAKEASDIQDK